MTRELEKCPHCGGVSVIHGSPMGGYIFGCDNIKCFASASNSCAETYDEAFDQWNTRADPWNHDMEAGKGEGVILLEFHINGKRRVSTGGWDTHWSGACWISDAVGIPLGIVPSRWMRLPHEGDGQ